MFGCWDDAPEWYVRDRLQMMPRIEADRRLKGIEDLLYVAGYQMAESERRGFLRSLEITRSGRWRPKHVPKITPGFAKRLGIKQVQEVTITTADDGDDDKREEVSSKRVSNRRAARRRVSRAAD